MSAQNIYQSLKDRMREISTLNSSAGVLSWDRKSYMPPSANDHRAEQIAQLRTLAHQWFTDPKVGEWLAEVEQSDLISDPEAEAAVNVREWRRMYDRNTKLPDDFVRDFATTTSKANQVWIEARKQSNFGMFLPYLEKVVDLCRRKAELIGYETEIYDALLDGFEPGAKAADVETAFAGLRTELVELVAKVKNAPNKPDIRILHKVWDVEKQRFFAKMIAAELGYDFSSGRIDETVHPCCNMLGPRDVRILTRFSAHDFGEGLTGTIHEAGHSFYSLSQEESDQWGMPATMTPSLAIHESQSRTWENIVGRSREFWVYFFPQLQGVFPEETRGVTLDDFYGAMNWVSPSYIRVEADEATYNLHIMLRFELEREIIKGELPVKDVANEWNRRFKEYFGIEVDKDANGCLQDTHWSDGNFGYFPTYALGNLYAAQFWTQIRKDLPGIKDDFAAGRFERLMTWLSENIHRKGFTHYPNDLCRKLTGEPLSHKPLLDYLYEKYGEVYGISRG